MPGLGNVTLTRDGWLNEDWRCGISRAVVHAQGALDELWSHSTVCGLSVSRFSQVIVPPTSISMYSGCHVMESCA